MRHTSRAVPDMKCVPVCLAEHGITWLHKEPPPSFLQASPNLGNIGVMCTNGGALSVALICIDPEAVYRLTLHQQRLAPRFIGSSPASDLHGFNVWALHGRCQIRGFKSVEDPNLVTTRR
jgi:hypothetical protein